MHAIFHPFLTLASVMPSKHHWQVLQKETSGDRGGNSSMGRRARPQADKVGSNGDDKVQVDNEGSNGGNGDIVSDSDADSDSSTGNTTPRGRSNVPAAVASPVRASQRYNRGMGRAPSDSASAALESLRRRRENSR
jgi:hypothetical protein